MTNHIDIVVSDPRAAHTREGVAGDPVGELHGRYSEIELHERGVRGAFLFDGGGMGFMAGVLQAVYHHASGSPEWVRFHEDPREDWTRLSAEAKEQLLALNLGDADPYLEVDPIKVVAVPVDSGFHPEHGSSFDGERTYEHHVIRPDLVGFLWVLQQYEETTGKPLQVVREDRGHSM